MINALECAEVAEVEPKATKTRNSVPRGDIYYGFDALLAKPDSSLSKVMLFRSHLLMHIAYSNRFLLAPI